MIGSETLRRHIEKDPSKLRGLGQAIFILEEICGGHERNELIRKLHGYCQLVALWMNFLQHNHWMVYNESAREWVLTDKGKEWVKNNEKVLPSN